MNKDDGLHTPDREGDVLSYYCNFDLINHYKVNEQIPKEKIIIRELDDFGHTYERPKGVRKMNILV